MAFLFDHIVLPTEASQGPLGTGRREIKDKYNTRTTCPGCAGEPTKPAMQVCAPRRPAGTGTTAEEGGTAKLFRIGRGCVTLRETGLTSRLVALSTAR